MAAKPEIKAPSKRKITKGQTMKVPLKGKEFLIH
jgi:hypothetical protein